MLAENTSLRNLWTRIESATSEASAFRTLAIIAPLTVVIYMAVFAYPYSLLRYYLYPQIDIYTLSMFQPGFRYVMIAAFGLLGLLYALAYHAALKLTRRDAWILVLWGALMCALDLMLLYPFGSTDIWDYVIHGRMISVYGINPFVEIAADVPFDRFISYVGWPWATSAYGPLWEVFATVTTKLAGDGIIANAVAFKMLNFIFLAGSTYILAKILLKVAPEKALAGVLLFTWNPVMIVETMGNGHNDIVMIFFILAAVWALMERRPALAIVSLMAGALVKFIPLLLLPAAGLIALRDLPDGRARLRFLIATALATIGITVMTYAVFWHGFETLSLDRRAQLFTTSLPTIIYQLLSPNIGAELGAKIVSRLAAGITVLYALYEGVRAWRDRSWSSFARSAFGISMCYALYTALWFMPWYSLWALALLPLLMANGRPSHHETRLTMITLFATVSLRFVIEPLALWTIEPHTIAWQQLRLSVGMFAIPWAYSLYVLGSQMARWVKERRGNSRVVPAE